MTPTNTCSNTATHASAHTRRKALKSGFSESTTEPQLALHYSNAHKAIFGKKLFVNKKMWGKFRVFEDDLRERGIKPMDYAYTMVRVLKNWAQDKGMDFVPIPTFLSDWVMDRYMKILTSESVTINKPREVDEAAMLHSELLVGRTYIVENTHNVVRLAQVVASLRPFLSYDWLALYDRGDPRRKLLEEALPILCQEFTVKARNVTCYPDIVDALLK